MLVEMHQICRFQVTQPPLTMGENLAKQARKIDFSLDGKEADKEKEKEMEVDAGEGDIKSF